MTCAADISDVLPVQAIPWVAIGWYLLAAVSLIAGGVFAGNEIGIFSLSRVRLRLRTARGEPNALVLNQWLRQPTYALEGLLILQNIAGFAFSASVTAILSTRGYSELVQALISIAIVTPTVLIFADIMPKDLFHSHADRWTYRLVPLLRVMFKIITIVPLLPAVNFLSRLSMRMVKSKRTAETVPRSPRLEMLSLFEESAATGALTGTQQDLVQRALRLARISVREIMIPWANVVGVPAAISSEGFRALVRRYNFSRMPVMGRSMNEVLGTIDVLDVLMAYASRPAAATPASPYAPPPPEPQVKLIEHLSPAMTLIGEQSVRSAITLMQSARQTLAVVVDRQGRAIGLVTMKDLVEELVGDLETW